MIITERLSAKHLIMQPSRIVYVCMYVSHTSGSNVCNGCGLVPWTVYSSSQIEDMNVIGQVGTTSNDTDRGH